MESDRKRLETYPQTLPEQVFWGIRRTRLVGTVTTITYGREVAWVGMMLVKGEYRGRGIGKRLMRASLDYCAGCQIETVKLDATPAGRLCMNLWVSLRKSPFNAGKALLGLAFKGRGHVRVRPITKGFMNLTKGVWRGPATLSVPFGTKIVFENGVGIWRHE